MRGSPGGYRAGFGQLRPRVLHVADGLWGRHHERADVSSIPTASLL